MESIDPVQILVTSILRRSWVYICLYKFISEWVGVHVDQESGCWLEVPSGMHTVFHSMATRASQKLCVLQDTKEKSLQHKCKYRRLFYNLHWHSTIVGPWADDIHNNTVMLCPYCVVLKGRGNVFRSKTNHPWIPAYLLRAQKHTHQLLLAFRLEQKLMTLLSWCFEWSLSITFCNVFHHHHIYSQIREDNLIKTTFKTPSISYKTQFQMFYSQQL